MIGYLSLYVIFFSIWFFLIYRKNGLNISSYIVGIYLFGMVCGILYVYCYPIVEHPERITIASVSSHILFLWLFLYPLVRYGNTLRPDHIKISRIALDIFSWFIIVPSLLSIIISLGDIGAVLSFGNLLDARNAFITGDISNLYISRFGALGYFIAIGPQLSFIALFLTFYRIFYLKNNSLTTKLLMLSSLGIVINNLAIAGREGIIRWILFAGFCLVFFKEYIDFRKHKKLFLSLSVVLVGILAFFMMISIDRFENSEYGVFASFLRYGGEQYYLYSYNFHFFADKGLQSIGQMFPLFSGKSLDIYDQNKLIVVDYFLNTFSTFVGSFIKQTGLFNTFIVSICAFLLFFLVFWKSKRISTPTLSKTVAFLFCYEIVLLGFFYYLHGTRMTQFSIILYIVIAFVCSHLLAPQKFKWIHP